MKRRDYLRAVGAALLASMSPPVASVSPSLLGSAGFLWTPRSLFPANTGAWFSAYDGTYMTVNNDGTGGSPAVSGTVGRLTDRSGGGNHVTQSNASLRPVRQTGYLGFSNVPGVSRQFLTNTATVGGTTRNSSGCLVMDLQGIPDNNIPFDWDFANNGNAFELTGSTSITTGIWRILTNGGFLSTGLKWPSKRVYFAWNCSASGFVLEINGVRFSQAALTSLNLGQMCLGKGGGGFPVKARFYELVLTTSALSTADFNALCQYGARMAQTNLINSDVLLARGDSLTGGVGSATCSPWILRSTAMPNAKQLCYGQEGDFAFSPGTSAASLLADYPLGAGRNMCVIWLGTNDLKSAARTPAQAEAAIAAYCGVMKTGGYKVVVCTLQDIVGVTVNVLATNVLIRANYTGYADAIADLGANANLQNSADLTYFNADGVHLTDAGYAVVASIIDPAISSIP